MPSVAEVQFKATGQQTVVSAFKSVGDSASTATTKVQQNSGAMKTLGTGMKTSLSGIAQVGTAFATLSLSIVGTWRAYRDLGDAQNAVDKANKKVTTATIALKKAQDEVNKLTAEGSKGSLESTAATNKIRLAEQKLAADRKSGKKTALELQVQQDAINLAKKEGAGKSTALAAAEEKLGVAQETLRINTNLAGEAQERFNDTQQNFYLSILPTALSGISTLSLGLSGLKGIFTGGGAGGLVGMFGPLGIAIAGISLAVIAFQTNFLGLRDKIAGVITWVKERFGAWKDTLEEVFGFIQKGDWAGAFNRIKQAAIDFWNDLVKTVPLFGHIAEFITAIKGGNWKGAFLMIWKAASDTWETIKKNVPILGKVEDVIKAISEGKWGDAFQTIADTAVKIFNDTLGKGIAFLFGDNWKLGLDAWLVLQEAEAKAKNRPLVLQYALTINATIVALTGIDIAKWFKEHPITAVSLNMPLSGITMSMEDPNFQAGLKKGAELIIQALGTALGTAGKLLDPYLAIAIKALNFNTAITSARDAILNAGQAIWDTIFQGIQGGFAKQDWTKLFTNFATTVNDAWKNNLPNTQQAIIDTWNNSPLAKGLAGLGVKFDVKPVPDPKTPQIIQNGVRTGEPYKVPLDADAKTRFGQQLLKVRADVGRKPATMKIDANLAQANAKWQAFARKVQGTTLQVKIAGTSVNIRKGSQAGAYGGPKQHGWNTTVKRPTMFMAGEGGRQEDVYVKQKGSAGIRPDGGGFSGTINVYVDGVLQKARYDINKFQGVMK